jgi:hypothetical protein
MASLFHSKEGQKEKGKIMIHPFQSCLMEATGGTPPGLALKFHCLRLDPGDNKKHFLGTVERR